MFQTRISVLIQAVDKATAVLKNVGKSVDTVAEKTSFLVDSAKIAPGVLIRDFVQGSGSVLGEISQLGGEIDTLKTSFERLVAAQGATNVSLEALRADTKGTVSDVDLLTSANQALLLGLLTENLDKLYESAMRLGGAMGITTQKAVESLTVELGRQSRMILDNPEVIVKSKDAYAWYAAQLS